jgi:hypothetical protein
MHIDLIYEIFSAFGMHSGNVWTFRSATMVVGTRRFGTCSHLQNRSNGKEPQTLSPAKAGDPPHRRDIWIDSEAHQAQPSLLPFHRFVPQG